MALFEKKFVDPTAVQTSDDVETYWFGIADARRKILKGQMVFVDRLLESAMAVCRDNR
jgi:predicted NUDIX family NTP pyrophosphohydrolase